MPTIYADSGDGMIYSPTDVWSNARGASSGTVNSTTNATEQEAISVFMFSGRGATTYRVYRSFFYFDTDNRDGGEHIPYGMRRVLLLLHKHAELARSGVLNACCSLV